MSDLSLRSRRGVKKHGLVLLDDVILLKYTIGDIGNAEDMEERRDLIPLLKPGDLVFFWKGHDTWKLTMFDEVMEDGRYAFITRAKPFTCMKLTPDRLWRYINFPCTADNLKEQPTSLEAPPIDIEPGPIEATKIIVK